MGKCMLWMTNDYCTLITLAAEITLQIRILNIIRANNHERE